MGNSRRSAFWPPAGPQVPVSGIPFRKRVGVPNRGGLLKSVNDSVALPNGDSHLLSFSYFNTIQLWPFSFFLSDL